jgi:hypothetical protein
MDQSGEKNGHKKAGRVRAARHIVIAIPAYTWTVYLPTMRSIIADMQTLISRGDKVTIYDESGSTDLPDARAVAAAHFLHETDGTHLVSVDNDVCWQAGGLVRLVDAGVDLVAGVYPKRRDPLEFPVRYIKDRAELWADPETGLLEVECVPGGFTCVTRSMLERMTTAHPDLVFRSSRYGADTPICGLYEPIREDGMRIGEDFSFCLRWRALGGKVWVDPDITMAHMGNKAFTGCFGDWLRAR